MFNFCLGDLEKLELPFALAVAEVKHGSLPLHGLEVGHNPSCTGRLF